MSLVLRNEKFRSAQRAYDDQAPSEDGEALAERIDALIEQYRANPAKVAEADQWMSGTLSEDAYAGIESMFADIGDRIPPTGMVLGSDLESLPQPVIDKIAAVAREASASRSVYLRDLAEAAANSESRFAPEAAA